MDENVLEELIRSSVQLAEQWQDRANELLTGDSKRDCARDRGGKS